MPESTDTAPFAPEGTTVSAVIGISIPQTDSIRATNSRHESMFLRELAPQRRPSRPRHSATSVTIPLLLVLAAAPLSPVLGFKDTGAKDFSRRTGCPRVRGQLGGFKAMVTRLGIAFGTMTFIALHEL